LVELDNIAVTTRALRTLSYGNEINDEIVNFFMRLLQRRDDLYCRQTGAHGSVFYSSMFYKRLLFEGKYDYSQVKTRKHGVWTIPGIFDKDMIVIPIHMEGPPKHWTLMVAHMKLKTVAYFDSTGAKGLHHIKIMLKWLGDVWADHYDNDHLSPENLTNFSRASCPSKLEATWWTQVDHGNSAPQQRASLDCGVFVMLAADYISAGLPLLYSQANCALYRELLASMMLPQ
jgi:Ulp1 family protease